MYKYTKFEYLYYVYIYIDTYICIYKYILHTHTHLINQKTEKMGMKMLKSKNQKIEKRDLRCGQNSGKRLDVGTAFAFWKVHAELGFISLVIP